MKSGTLLLYHIQSSLKREYDSNYYCFFGRLAYFILNSSKSEVSQYIKPFITNFNKLDILADLFQKFIFAEDYLNTYDNFWQVWNIFYENMLELCEKGDNYHTAKIIKSYLLAQSPWEKTAIEWHTLKKEDKRFFDKIVKNLGQYPSTLYSISKLLNNVGSKYLDSGISWIYNMLNDNKNLLTDELETDTIYYIENFLKNYINSNREEIRKTKKTKQKILVILDFLISRSSVIGYLLRENIL